MSYSSITASPRTVFNFTVYGLAGIKRLSAMCANRRTTRIANQRSARSGREIPTALAAFLHRNNYGEWAATNQFRMGSPKLLFGNAVTGRTQGSQIVQIIRFPIITEQSKWPDVVNRVTRALRSATLASVVIPLTRRFTLIVPVRAAILRMTTAPELVFATAVNASDRAPFVIAFAAAKVVDENLARHSFNFRSAIGTSNRDTISTLSCSVFRLPSSIALETAKRILGHGDMISFALDRLSTFGAMYCNHAFNYTTSGLSHKGAFCNG